MSDTIAAIATPAGAGGVGIVRISGPAALGVLATVSGRSAEGFADRVLVHGIARGLGGERIDEVLFVAMRGPRSFTGEDVVEIHGHGGTVNMARLLRAVVAAGARHATPGEFTRRAFENGRLDLVRAEAIIDIVEASSERACRLAQSQLGGGLGDEVRRLRTRGTELLALTEAGIDFPDDDLDRVEQEQVRVGARDVADRLGALVGTFALGRVVRDGIDVALSGPVNAGKSSLFNALLQAERALVAAEPGTTRDFVEGQLVWKGVSITLIDTAGEREAGDEIERRGIALGRQRSGEADLEVVLVPADGEVSIGESAGRRLFVLSKCDLVEGISDGVLATSAVDQRGLEALKDAMVSAALPSAAEGDDGLVVTSERQRRVLEEAREAFVAAEGLCGSSPPEVVAVELRSGNAKLAEFLGEEIGDEVLDALFATFCIGK